MAMLSKTDCAHKKESCIEIAHFDRIYVRLNTLKYVHKRWIHFITENRLKSLFSTF